MSDLDGFRVAVLLVVVGLWAVAVAWVLQPIGGAAAVLRAAGL